MPPFGAALLFLVQLFFLARVLAQADVIFGSAMRLQDVGKILLYLLPAMLSFGLPIAFLLGILIGLGRLADDRELTALEATGHAPHQLLPTPLFVGGVLTAILLVLTCWVEPMAMRAARAQTAEMIKRNLAGDVKGGVFYEDLSDLTLFAGEVGEDGALRQVLVEDSREPRAPLLVLAPEGRLDTEGQLVLRLHDGELHRAQGGKDAYALARFADAQVAVVADREISRKNRLRRPMETQTPKDILRNYERAESKGERKADYLVELHKRFSHPFVTLAFALVGVGAAGAATGRRTGGRAVAFGWTLGGVVGYFVLGKIFTTMGNRSVLWPWLAAWAPVLIIAAIGGATLLWRKQRGGAA